MLRKGEHLTSSKSFKIHSRADIALGSLSVMAERETYVDFTIPYYDLGKVELKKESFSFCVIIVGISILMKRSRIDTSLFKFMEVFELEVWCSILIAYVITAVLMWIFDRWSPFSYQNNMEKYQVWFSIFLKSIVRNKSFSLMMKRDCLT